MDLVVSVAESSCALMRRDLAKSSAGDPIRWPWNGKRLFAEAGIQAQARQVDATDDTGVSSRPTGSYGVFVNVPVTAVRFRRSP